MGVWVNWRSVFVWLLLVVAVCLLLPLFVSCSHQQDDVAGEGKTGAAQLYVVSWNVQTFFDAQTSGLEYTEFQGSKSRWSQELYEARLERLAESIELLDPYEAIVVGDTSFDIQMGRNAGTRTCGVTYGNGSMESLSDADWLIDDFGKLLDIVSE